MAVRARYVFAEAWSIARSGARQTAAAVALIALALYVPGLLVLLSGNLGRFAAAQGEPVTVVVTLDPSADARSIARRVALDRRVSKVRIVSSEAALQRFRGAYPDLGAALSGLKEAPFPPTLEIFLRAAVAPRAGSEVARESRKWRGVESAESEEGFDQRFRDAVRLLRAAGYFLGGLLILSAVLSVSSATRLALDLHRDEVEIMRLMGATESAVRAPFWLYAASEGLVGGVIGLALLAATHGFVSHALATHPHPVLSVFWASFLDWPTALAMPLAGAAAGFLGSTLSLARGK